VFGRVVAVELRTNIVGRRLRRHRLRLSPQGLCQLHLRQALMTSASQPPRCTRSRAAARAIMASYAGGRRWLVKTEQL
jgi:hypothetical protein